ncbi:phospholipase A1 member A-like [Contarinia nasturtii]|uniref:phospholipase A1 member A-like n=1 Tax=Contarinia nasturtii TaxID=265458 RepID=UPI0012D3DB58|nr:phospholipase A1 member A-like [Contarinia nasturtii]
MFWSKVIFSLLSLSVFSKINAAPDYKKEIQISCVSNPNATEFTTFFLKYDPRMSSYGHKFHPQQMTDLKNVIGNREKIIFFFLGHEDYLRRSAGRSFYVARAQMLKSEACTCTVSYAFLSGHELFKYAQYFPAINNRIPRVIEMMTTFIENIVDSNEFSIKLSSIYLTGFCLGGHIAGMIGQGLKNVYRGEMVPAIWAFDPPRIGFSPYNVFPRRVQKGNAKFVAVFHSSPLGVQDLIGDVDIMLNGGTSQPGCENEFNTFGCNHYAAFILRELILLGGDELRKNANGIAFATGEMNSSDQLLLDFTNPDFSKRGIYHIVTGAVFETKKEGFFDRFTKNFRAPGCF